MLGRRIRGEAPGPALARRNGPRSTVSARGGLPVRGLFFVLGAFGGAGCGGEDSAAPDGVERESSLRGTSSWIPLEPVGQPRKAPEDGVLLDLSFATEGTEDPARYLLRDWTAVAGRPRSREGSWRGDDPTTPTLGAPGAFALGLSIDLDVGPWTVLEFTYRCPQALAPWAELRGEGGRVWRAQGSEDLEPTGSLASTVRLWFGPSSKAVGEGEQPAFRGSELRLGFADAREPGNTKHLRVDLVGLRILSSSPRRFFEGRERGPEDGRGLHLTFLDSGDARRAAVLGDGDLWAGRIPLEPGLELRFDEGRPADLPVHPGTSTLRLELEIDDGRQLLFEREIAPGSEAGWRAHRIELDPWIERARESGLEVDPGEDAVLLASFEGEASGVHGIASLRTVRPRSAPKTVLLVTSDTHRGDYLRGASPFGDAVTPALDALGERGVVFEHCLSTTNITNPSHVSLLTGLHPRDTGILDNQVILRNEARTLAETFREEGFATLGLVAARHLGPSVAGLGQGFQHMAWSDRAEPRDAEEQVDRLLAALPSFEGESLFCWLHLFDAHEPYGAPEPWDRHYVEPGHDPRNPEVAVEPLETRQRARWAPMIADAQHVRGLYAGEVSYLDAELGRLFAAPRLADAILAVTGDHGESLGERNLYFSHAGLHRASLHVPLILAGPGIEPGQVSQATPRHQDLGRTLLDLAGCGEVDFPGGMLIDRGGRALGAASSAPPGAADSTGVTSSSNPSTELRFALGREAWLASVTRGRRHLVMALVEFGEHQRWAHAEYRRHRAQLFDLGEDPDCTRDLASIHPTEVAELRGALIEWLREGASVRGLAGDRRNNARLNAQLEALGYVVAEESTERPALFPGSCDCEECAAFDSDPEGD